MPVLSKPPVLGPHPLPVLRPLVSDLQLLADRLGATGCAHQHRRAFRGRRRLPRSSGAEERASLPVLVRFGK